MFIIISPVQLLASMNWTWTVAILSSCHSKVSLPAIILRTCHDEDVWFMGSYLPISRNISLSASKACNAMNWPGDATISLYILDSSLTYAACPWSVHCKCSLMQSQQQIFNYLHIPDTSSVKDSHTVVLWMYVSCKIHVIIDSMLIISRRKNLL